MPHDLPKSYEPSEIEKRWAEFWISEELFQASLEPESEDGLGAARLGTDEGVRPHNGGRGRPPHTHSAVSLL